MQALANFFRINAAYFTDDEYYAKLDKELTWLANTRDEGCPSGLPHAPSACRRRPSRTSSTRSMSCVAGEHLDA